MIARAAWFIVLGAVAVITAGLQFDRQSRYAPHLASSVPSPFRAFAQPHIVADAMNSGDNERALSEARKLVAIRPMPAEHLRLLSFAEFRNGEIEEGSYSIQLAARRGWRDLSAQIAMLELARAAGDQPETARRFAALFLHPGQDTDALSQIAGNVFAEGSGETRAVFADILAGSERWNSAFMRNGAGVIPPAAFVDITRLASKAGARFTCREIDLAKRRLSRIAPEMSEDFTSIIEYC